MDLIKELDKESNKGDMLLLIRERVQTLLNEEPSLLMSYLYRLDVLEHKIKAVLHKSSGLDPVDGFSELILERQIERLATKQKFKQEPIKGMEW